MPKSSIADQLNIFDYPSYEAIPSAKRTWITIKAKQRGKNPKMVHAGIKAAMAKRAVLKKTPKNSPTKKISNKKASKNKGNMYALSVKQWNPFVGCKYDCSYCKTSFQAQAKRQKQRCIRCYQYTPHTHPERLTASIPNTEADEFIFTCSSGDISFCPTPFLKKIVKRIQEEPQKTFLIQSKNPKTFERVDFPTNVILGVTLETNRDELYDCVSKAPKPSTRYRDFLKVRHPRKMVTIEPVIDFDLDVMVKWIKQIKPCMVWLGYDSRRNDLPEPSDEKFQNLHRELMKAGIKVKLKTVKG